MEVPKDNRIKVGGPKIEKDHFYERFSCIFNYKFYSLYLSL